MLSILYLVYHILLLSTDNEVLWEQQNLLFVIQNINIMQQFSGFFYQISLFQIRLDSGTEIRLEPEPDLERTCFFLFWIPQQYIR